MIFQVNDAFDKKIKDFLEENNIPYKKAYRQQIYEDIDIVLENMEDINIDMYSDKERDELYQYVIDDVCGNYDYCDYDNYIEYSIKDFFREKEESQE